MYRLVLTTAVVLLALPLSSRFTEAGGSPPATCSAEKKDQETTGGDQVAKTPGTDPYHLKHPCLFLNMLYNYSTCGCIQPANGGPAPSAQDILDFQTWINVTASGILESAGASINETVICQLIYSMNIFFSTHASLESSINYQSLFDATGTFWGSVEDFRKLEVSFQFELIDSTVATGTSIISLDSSNQCRLMQAITAAGSASGNQTIESACYNLTVSIQQMLMIQGQYNLTEQLSFIYELATEADSECPGLLNFLNLNCQIPNFGSFMSLMSVSQTISLTVNMQYYMNIQGHTQSTVPFLEDLVEVVNTCTGTPPVVCATLNQLLGQINATISDTTIVDIVVRHGKCANQIYQMCLLSPWICEVEMPGCGCKLSDIEFCHAFCTNEDICSCMESPPPTLPPASGSGESGQSGSGETPVAGSGSGASGETGATESAGSGETPVAGSGSGASGETGATESAGSGETPVAGSGSGASGETGATESAGSMETPVAGSGSGASGETGATESAESMESVTPGSGSVSNETDSGETTAIASTAPPTTAQPTTTQPTTQAPTTTPPTTTHPTTQAPTTTPPTTTQPTTQAPTTTPPKCNTRGNLLKQVACGCSSFWFSIWRAYATWSVTIQSSFNISSTAANIKLAIFNDTLYPMPSDKVNKLVSVCKSWLYYNSTLSVNTIYLSDNVTVWGTFGDFVHCGNCISSQCNP